MVEFSPATREARVRFPAGAISFFHFYSLIFFFCLFCLFCFVLGVRVPIQHQEKTTGGKVNIKPKKN